MPLIPFAIPGVAEEMKRAYNVLDRWGRKWLVFVELRTGHMIGPAVPVGFSDPIDTPPQYFGLDPRDHTKLDIDYQSWSDALLQERREWGQRINDVGHAEYGENYDENAPPTARLIRICGKPPMDHNIPLRALAGEPQFLGVAPRIAPESEVLQLRHRVAELEAQLKLGSSPTPVPAMAGQGQSRDEETLDVDLDSLPLDGEE